MEHLKKQVSATLVLYFIFNFSGHVSTFLITFWLLQNHFWVCIWIDKNIHSWLTSIFSTFWRNLKLTDSRASCGHSWNQSMAVQLTTAGNFLLRSLSLLPTGEKQRTTWSRHTKTRSNRAKCQAWCKNKIIAIFIDSIRTTQKWVSQWKRATVDSCQGGQ